MMASYTCKGTLKLSGVTFFIEAENEDEAKAKAENGEYEDWDYNNAEHTD